MNIALYLKHFPAAGTPIIGGTATAIHGLACGLTENGAAVTVLCEGERRSSITTDVGYRVECFPAVRRRFRIHHEFARYLRERLAGSGAVVVVNGMFHPGVYAVARAAADCGIPYVVAPHTPYERSVFSKNRYLKVPYWWLFERRLLRGATAVQLLDARHAVSLVELGIQTPVFDVPNGVCLKTAPSVQDLRWRGVGPARLLFFGRIDAYTKGLDILLEAFSRVVALHDVRLTIQGPDWGDRAQLERLVKSRSLAGKVIFRDADHRRPGASIMTEHDVLCLSSRFEGFGLSALEAMLAARVLVVPVIAGIAPHVEASGCGVTVQSDVASVTEGILAILQDRPQWKERGMKGRAYACDNLSWERITRRALEQYEALAA